ncbi:MAG TPA: hypothetical protein VF950_03925 [Planctomycetota bacterium]
MARESGLPVVLVIDDDAGRRVHVAAILRRNGYACASTSPARGALEFAAQMKPDLVLARRRESAEDAAGLLVDVKRVLPAARVVLFSPSLQRVEGPG